MKVYGDYFVAHLDATETMQQIRFLKKCSIYLYINWVSER